MIRHHLQRFGNVALLAAIAVALGPRSACAHTGVGPTHDLLHGLAHPLTGIDHLLAMFAVGLWAAGRGGRTLWLAPLTFVLAMMLGTALGISGVSIPFVEPGIAISVLMMGLFVASAVRLPISISAVVISFFALFHGHAHGAEIAATASAVAYTLGFIAATVFLHATGIGFGLASQRIRATQLVRYAGAAIAICGLFLCIR